MPPPTPVIAAIIPTRKAVGDSKAISKDITAPPTEYNENTNLCS